MLFTWPRFFSFVIGKIKPRTSCRYIQQRLVLYCSSCVAFSPECADCQLMAIGQQKKLIENKIIPAGRERERKRKEESSGVKQNGALVETGRYCRG